MKAFVRCMGLLAVICASFSEIPNTLSAAEPGDERALQRKKAEAGDADVQLRLGASYYSGQGVPQDYTEAVKWYRKAAEQGVAKGQYCLGLMYTRGEGVVQSEFEGYVWLSLAAAQGDEDARKVRDALAQKMSRQEIVEGQRRAAAFVPHQASSSE